MFIVHAKQIPLILAMVVVLAHPLRPCAAEPKAPGFAERFEEYIAAPKNYGFRDAAGMRSEDLGVITKYMTASDEESRGRARGAVLEILDATQEPALRRALVDALVVNSTDDESFLGSVPRLRPRCLAADFTAESKRLILSGATELNKRGKLHGDLVQLLGVAEIHEALPLLEEAVQQEGAEMGCDPFHPTPDSQPKGFDGTLSWHCLLVRARLGDEAAMDKAIALIDSLPTEEERSLVACISLPYTCQRKAVEYLKKFLYSDTLVDGRFPSTKVPCGERVLDPLKVMIPDLPGREGLDACRKWMTEHANDYRISFRSSHMVDMQTHEEAMKKWREHEKASQGQSNTYKKDGTP